MRTRLKWIGKALALCAGAFSCGVSTTALAAKEPQSLARAGKWVLDYDAEACRLGGSFGTGKDEVVLRITRFQPGDIFDMDLIGQRLDISSGETRVSVDFGPANNPRVYTPMIAKAKGVPMLIGLGGDLLDLPYPTPAEPEHPPITPRQEAAVTYVDIHQAARAPFRLELGAMDAPMRAMRACTDDLVRSWGLDPHVQETLKRRAEPEGSPGKWVNSNDYPKALLKNGNHGLIHFRLAIDEAGAVSSCHIQSKTKPEGFAELTCHLITKRAKFKPALDATGHPAKSFYINRVKWFISED